MTGRDHPRSGVMIPIPQYPLYTATIAEYNACAVRRRVSFTSKIIRLVFRSFIATPRLLENCSCELTPWVGGGGNVSTCVCLSVCLFAKLIEKSPVDFREIYGISARDIHEISSGPTKSRLNFRGNRDSAAYSGYQSIVSFTILRLLDFA